MSGVDNNMKESEDAREPRQDKKDGAIRRASMPKREELEAPMKVKDNTLIILLSFLIPIFFPPNTIA